MQALVMSFRLNDQVVELLHLSFYALTQSKAGLRCQSQHFSVRSVNTVS